MSQPPPSARSLPARPDFVRLANRIAGRRRTLSFDWNGQRAHFGFSNATSHPRGSWSLGIVMGGHPLSVEISRLPDLTWIDPTLAGVDVHALPPELACGLIEASFGEIFTALCKLGIDVKITSVEPFTFRDAAEEIIGWQVDRGAQTCWIHGHVSGSDAALGHLAGLISKAPVQEGAGTQEIPVPVHLVAGALTLPLADWRALQAHDVLLAGGLREFNLTRTCTMQAAGRSLAMGTLKDKSFTLQNLIATPATTMGDPAKPASVNDIDIELTFVAGHTTLSVAELRGLAPGFTFELPVLAGEGLTICANGRPVGKGELIEVGDHLGVRITEFSAS